MQPTICWLADFQIKAGALNAQALHVFTTQVRARVLYDRAKRILRDLEGLFRRLGIGVHIDSDRLLVD